jgi:hypothetical protein
MSRLAPSIAILIAASTGAPALAADYTVDAGAMEFRTGYQSYEPKDWTELGEEGDGLHFETGLRYWYSMGSQSFEETSTGTFESNDTAHSGEAFLRIEDDATSTYAKGWAGYSAAISGDFTVPAGSGDIVDGKIAYAGADFGWNMFSDGQGTGAGGFIGYNYWNNSSRTARADFATAETAADVAYSPDTGEWSVGGDSVDDSIDYHMLRLGLSGKAELTDFFDISGEVALVPYAKVGGVLGGHNPVVGGVFGGSGCQLGFPCDDVVLKASETSIDGWGYGAMAEVMAGFKPTENLTLRLGGRAWYLQGTYDATWREVAITPPVEQPPVGDPPTAPDPLYSAPDLASQHFISTANPFSAFRFGLLAELTYSF